MYLKIRVLWFSDIKNVGLWFDSWMLDTENFEYSFLGYRVSRLNMCKYFLQIIQFIVVKNDKLTNHTILESY